jgi:hypothetical protein
MEHGSATHHVRASRNNRLRHEKRLHLHPIDAQRPEWPSRGPDNGGVAGAQAGDGGGSSCAGVLKWEQTRAIPERLKEANPESRKNRPPETVN